jgi:hypothetical protein
MHLIESSRKALAKPSKSVSILVEHQNFYRTNFSGFWEFNFDRELNYLKLL